MKYFTLLLIVFFCSCVSSKNKAELLINSFETGDLQVWQDHVDENYIQHNHRFEDGRDTVIESIKMTKGLDVKTENLLSLESDDFIVTLNYWELMGKKYSFDIFRLEKGVITEHWDNIESIKKHHLKGYEFIPPSSKRLGKNRKLAEEYIKGIIAESNIKRDFKDISTQADKNLVKKYSKIEKIIGEGEYVLIVSSGSVESRNYAFYDLLQITNNKIAAKFSISEKVPDTKYWKNSNGKFFN